MAAEAKSETIHVLDRPYCAVCGKTYAAFEVERAHVLVHLSHPGLKEPMPVYARAYDTVELMGGSSPFEQASAAGTPVKVLCLSEHRWDALLYLDQLTEGAEIVSGLFGPEFEAEPEIVFPPPPPEDEGDTPF